MKWPAVVSVCAVVAGIVSTMALGHLQGEQAVKLWAYFLATIVALWRPGGRLSDRPPGPGDRLWPLAVLGSGEAVDVVDSLLSLVPPSESLSVY